MKTEAMGLLLGVFGALVLLVAASVWLLSTPETSVKVLVAVWLWALPILGIGALAGWLVGRMASRLFSTASRSS